MRKGKDANPNKPIRIKLRMLIFEKVGSPSTITA
jgi:hypothetical protein